MVAGRDPERCYFCFMVGRTLRDVNLICRDVTLEREMVVCVYRLNQFFMNDTHLVKSVAFIALNYVMI